MYSTTGKTAGISLPTAQLPNSPSQKKEMSFSVIKAFKSLGKAFSTPVHWAGKAVSWLSFNLGLTWCFHSIVYNSRVASSLSILRKAGILTEENKKAVISHERRWSLTEDLKKAQRAGILTQENFQAIITYDRPYSLVNPFIRLQLAGILTPENRQAIISCLDPESLATIFIRLRQAGIFNQDNFETVISHKNIFTLAKALNEIQNLLTQNTFQAVVSARCLYDVETVVHDLKQAGLLTQDNLEIIIRYDDSTHGLMDSFILLQKAGIFTPENRYAITSCSEPVFLANIFISLQEAGILTPENRQAAIGYQNLGWLTYIFKSLQKAGLLTQDNLATLMGSFVLRSIDINLYFWHRVPSDLLTPAVWQEVVRLSNLPHAERAIIDYGNRLLGG